MLQKLMSDPTLVHALKQRGADIPRGLKAITPRFRKAYRSMETGFKDLGERMRHERLKAWKVLLGSLGIGGGVYAMSRPSGRTHGNQVWIGGEDAS